MANVDVWVSKQITLRFGWWQDSQSVENNSSVVGWHLQLIASGGYISSSASKSWSVTVNGNNYSGTSIVGISSGQTKTLASGSTTIGHNADGTKSFSFSFSQQFDITYTDVGWIGTKSGSGSGTLSTIPRTSSVSSTNANIEDNITISINRSSSSFTHTLSYTFGNLSGTIADKTSSTSVSWTIPTSFYAEIPNAKSGWGTIYCATYSGSTLIGTSSCWFYAYVSEARSYPSISATVIDVNPSTTAITGDPNILIKYYSKVRYDLSATPYNSATISTLSVYYNGQTFTGGSGNSWTDYFSDVISGYYYFSVADSRGFTNNLTVNKTMIDYVKPTCYLHVSNPTISGNCTLTITGNYFNGSLGATNNELVVRYYVNNGAWQYATATISGNTYTATVNVTGLDYSQSYTYQAQAYDKLTSADSDFKTVKTSPIFDWGSDDFHFHVKVLSNDSFRMGPGTYLYGTNTNGVQTAIARINPNNNDLELGESHLRTILNSSEIPKWNSWNYDGVYDIWTSKDCIFSSDNICLSWRFQNGMQVSVIKIQGTWDVTTAWGSIYSSSWIGGQSFNRSFADIPKVIINAYAVNGSMMICQCTPPTTTATGAAYLWKPVAISQATVCIEYIAIGRWKL